jgi:hypothetical protein
MKISSAVLKLLHEDRRTDRQIGKLLQLVVSIASADPEMSCNNYLAMVIPVADTLKCLRLSPNSRLALAAVIVAASQKTLIRSQ